MTLVMMAGVMGLYAACHAPSPAASSSHETTGSSEQASKTDTAHSLYATLASVAVSPSLHDSLMIRFTVNNPTDAPLRFTTYHTPFEGFISKFLTVTDSRGHQVDYTGAMARRIMPPPENTYHTVAAGESEAVVFDLKKGYKIAHAGTYTLQYNSERISGIANGASITITVVD